ncbi:MAG: nuclear transport factor 2 family protein [Acidobacteria bacterium]|nr:nuclear transport factor 2 family protein [Acidobacteriota bacterium]
MGLGRDVGRRATSYVFVSFLLLILGFGMGFISCLHTKTSAPDDVRKLKLQVPGDAPTEVRREVLTALRVFQDGYIRRDPKNIEAFAERTIARNDDVLLLGTDTGEWVRGYPAVADFIKRDWLGWGDFRFDVDDSIVSSSGNVAWITSIGLVHFKTLDRPVRFSAVLTKEKSAWMFQQIHFQWDDKDPSSADLLRPRTYLTLPKLTLQRILKRHG